MQQERHPQRLPSGSVVCAIMADDWTPTCGLCLGDVTDHDMVIAPLLHTLEIAADPSRSAADHGAKRSHVMGHA